MEELLTEWRKFVNAIHSESITESLHDFTSKDTSGDPYSYYRPSHWPQVNPDTRIDT